jgi:succinate-semialdehyde dehydrogenase/glutarate-semialdehyde dehydrogenase
MTIRAINPTTGKTIRTYAEMAPAKVTRAIAQAHDAFLGWRQTSMAERAQRMHQAAKFLRDQATAYALLMAQEMGKPVKDGRAEVEKCAWVCDFYAEQATQFLMPEVVETEASRSFVTFQDKAAQIAHTAYAEGTSLRAACVKLGVLTGEAFDEIVRPEAMTHP